MLLILFKEQNCWKTKSKLPYRHKTKNRRC